MLDTSLVILRVSEVTESRIQRKHCQLNRVRSWELLGYLWYILPSGAIG